MRTVAIIQARARSTRLPGKVFLELAGKPVLVHVIDRAARITGVNDVVVATSENPADLRVASLARSAGAGVFRGSEHDVLQRFQDAATEYDAEVIVRITADCPLLDPAVSSGVLDYFESHDCDYVSNIKPPTYPDGLDTEVFSREALDRACREATLTSHREHVTPYLWRTGLFKVGNVYHSEDLSHLRWTLDGPEDLRMLQALSKALGDRFGSAELGDILKAMTAHPEIPEINGSGLRNESMERQFAQETAETDRA